MKLAIGTVQFGLNYGIMNTTGQTSNHEVALILERGKLAGIDTLDTAAAYGDSEQVLGEIGIKDWKAISKVPPIPNDITNGREWVVKHVRQSLDRLQVDRLEGILLHNATDLLKKQGRNIAVGLQQVKDEGLVNKIGYSIYSPQPLSVILKCMLPDLIQSPFNILDRRLVQSGWLNRLVNAGVEVHVRSIFLQGLLLMERTRRPPFFDRWNKLWHRWDTMINESGSNALSLCLGFVNEQRNISRIIVGVENQSHLEQLLTIWKEPVSVDGRNLFCNDPLLLEPFNWQIK
jgi:aryl-alcohol dehydrogenase-like predicted oxidoreductase